VVNAALRWLPSPDGCLQLQAINTALLRDREARENRAELAELEDRYASLAPREREALPLAVSGLMNKQAAAELGISEVTLQIHRSKVMQKMKARSVADLVRMAERLNVPLRHPHNVRAQNP
jgi:FixJ family two-component response regulator